MSIATTCAGTLAIVSLPLRMFTFTSGPVPLHSNLYSPAGISLPSMVTGVARVSDFLFPLPANVAAENNSELPTNRVKSFVTFMCNSLLFFSWHRALETALRPAEDFDLVRPTVRWLVGVGVTREARQSLFET